MVKVLIYSSKQIYDTVSYEGRAEADFIAYRDDQEYVVLKNKTNQYVGDRIYCDRLGSLLRMAERDEHKKEMLKLREGQLINVQ